MNFNKINLKYFLELTVYFLLIVFLPLISNNSVEDPTLSIRYVYFAMGVLALTVIRFNKVELQITKEIKWVYLIAFLFAFLIFISSIWARAKSLAYVEFGKEMLQWLFAFLTFQILVQYKDAARKIYFFVLVSSLIIVVYFLQKNYLVFFRNKYQLVSVSGNKNLFSFLLLLIFPLGIMSIMKIKALWGKIPILAFYIFAFIFVIWKLQTFSVFVGFFISALLFIVIFLFYFFKLPFKLCMFFIVLSSCFVSTTLYVQFANNKSYLNTKISNYNIQKPGNSLQERYYMWKQTLPMIKDNLILGVGAGNWQIEFLKNGAQDLAYMNRVANKYIFIKRPHNDFIWILGEQGLLGFLLFLFPIILIFYLGLKQFFKNNNFDIFILLFFFCSYYTASLFDFPKERFEIRMYLGLLIGVLCYKISLEQTLKSIQITKSLFLFNISILLLVICNSYYVYSGDLYSNKIVLAKEKNQWNEIIQHTKKINPYFYEIDAMGMPVKWYEATANFSLGKRELAFIKYADAQKTVPNNVFVLTNLGTCYELLQNHDSAKFYFERAIQIDPYFGKAIKNLSVLYFNDSNYNKALSLIGNGVDYSKLSNKEKRSLFIAKFKLIK